MKPDISVIIPAFEEEARIGQTLHRILLYIDENGISAEIIVVDDGSRDATSEIAAAEFAKFPQTASSVIRCDENRGKGFAVRTGLSAAAADIALFSDADLSTPIEEMPKLIEPIKSGKFDVTFGSRALDRSLIGTHQPWRREQGGKLFNLVVRLMTGLHFWDTQCGFKAFNMAKFRPLLHLMQIERFGFDVEFLYVAQLNGLKLIEIPVRWDNDERSKVNVFRDSFRMFNEVRRIRRNSKKGFYEIKQQ
ncbi:MAG TPA: glycosyl transferase [Blastocatellia bacterium]|nr:glycosyl transferase [Blastocatellia bacterium]